MFGTGGNIIINKNMPIIIKTVKCTCFWLMLTIMEKALLGLFPFPSDFKII